MKFLVTGGAGFIGRWVVLRLLQDGHQVLALDNLSSGCETNLEACRDQVGYLGLVRGELQVPGLMAGLLKESYDGCIHLAGSINVQKSLDDPAACLEANVTGTLRVLEAARRHGTKVSFVSTCMVYAPAGAAGSIGEDHPVCSASPYAASKLAAEQLVLAYHRGYGLPATILRPFNTYGPYQRTDGEGGVVAVFLRNLLAGRPLDVFGTGHQTRDLLYVSDCADFVVRAALSPAADGQVLNAGTGQDIAMCDLALLVAGDAGQVRFAPHPHPRSEISRLCCNSTRARQLLGWVPTVSLAEGIARTRTHLEEATCGR